MFKIKRIFAKSLSVALHPELDDGKKFALQVVTLDIYWSMVAFIFYFVNSLINGRTHLAYYSIFGFCMMGFSLFLMMKRHYDSARILVHQVGLYGIFLAVDAFTANSGMEYFYYAQILIPHISFDLNEFLKSIVLSSSACALLITQEIVGTGIFVPQLNPAPNDKLTAIIFVMLFTLSVLAVARWRLWNLSKEIARHQDELIHSSKLVALGEMSSSIAHEINNPLQALSLQLLVLKDKVLPVNHHDILKMEDTIQKMGRMVQGLKDLSRIDSTEPKERFLFTAVIDDVLPICSRRLEEKGIELKITGNCQQDIYCNPVQISQVLINLLNNSIDAVASLPIKWIEINLEEKKSFLQVCVTDSGHKISREIATKMMTPFFTTKKKKGTGLGLSISKSIIQKNSGSLRFDSEAYNTRFVILLPLATEFSAELVES